MQKIEKTRTIILFIILIAIGGIVLYGEKNHSPKFPSGKNNINKSLWN
jgi:hypothetical protein